MATKPLSPPRHLPPRGDAPWVPHGVPWRCHPGYPWCPQVSPSPGTPLPLEMSPQLSPVSPEDATPWVSRAPQRCPWGCPQCPLQVPPLGAPPSPEMSPWLSKASPGAATPGCPPPWGRPPIPLRCHPRVPPIPTTPASPPHGWWRRVPRPVVVVGGGTQQPPPSPPPRCAQGTMPVGGGLLCAASGLALLVTATATDFWLQHRAPGGTAAVGLWHLCLGGHCRPPPGPPGRHRLCGQGAGVPACPVSPTRVSPQLSGTPRGC